MDSLAILYKVYVKTNDSGVIIAIDSDAFITDTTNWTEIDSGYTDKYHHAQTQYLENGLTDIDGAFNYKLVGDVVTERTDEEKAADVPEIEVPIPMYNTTVSNPNLLINPDFKINQRGKTEYDAAGYTVDRWQLAWVVKGDNPSAKVSVNDNGVTLDAVDCNAYLINDMENVPFAFGKSVTLSICFGGIIYSETANIPTETPDTDTGIITLTSSENLRIGDLSIMKSGGLRVQVDAMNGRTNHFEWVKLELGSVATPFVSPNPAEELLKIQSMNVDGTPRLVSDSTLPTIMNSQMVSNPNLLVNPDFKINQRGQTEYTHPATEGTRRVFTVDRWFSWLAVGRTVTVNDEYISFVGCSCRQRVGDVRGLCGKTVTLSICYRCSDATNANVGILVNDTQIVSAVMKVSDDWNTIALTANIPNDASSIEILASATSYDLKWAKLEIGSVATAFTPPDPATELVKCQRYYYNSNGQIVFAAANTMVPRQNYYSLPVTMRTYPTITVFDATGTEGYASLRRDDTTKVAISTACGNARDFNFWATNDDFVVDSEYRLTFTASAEL